MRKLITYDIVKYSVFDIINFAKKEGFEVELSEPGKVNQGCLERWEKKKHNYSKKEIQEHCKENYFIYIKILNSGIMIRFPENSLSNQYKVFDGYIDEYTCGQRDYYLNPKNEECLRNNKKLWSKLRRKFHEEDNYIKSPEIKDIDKIVSFIEENIKISKEELLKNKEYIRLVNMRDMSVIEKKEFQFRVDNNKIYLNKKFENYIHHKYTICEDWENISWTPTYPNWEEDVKKHPELDPRKNGKKKSYFKKLFSKD